MPSKTISFKNKTILVCPLDWGLGHAARCIPLIQQLQKQDNSIIVACTEKQKTFLLAELSSVKFVDLFGYEVRYSRIFPLWMMLARQFSRLRNVVTKENVWLAGFLKENKIDVVISDNRFGLYNKHVESIFITHQLNIKTPFLSGLINFLNRRYIKRFNECWIPDFEDEKKSLGGELSHGSRINKKTRYIGPLSRLHKIETADKKLYDVLILLSGVEPQRTVLEEKLLTALKNSSLKIALVRGTDAALKKTLDPSISVVNMATKNQLEYFIASSNKVICRSGYSSLMDLYTLDKFAILVPTPGQTEQEYLADYWKTEFNYQVLKQEEISEAALLKLLA